MDRCGNNIGSHLFLKSGVALSSFKGYTDNKYYANKVKIEKINLLCCIIKFVISLLKVISCWFKCINIRHQTSAWATPSACLATKGVPG